MRFNIKEILKFLFPEWQIVDSINKEGLIRLSNHQNKQQHQYQTQGTVQASGDGYATASPPNPTVAGGYSPAPESYGGKTSNRRGSIQQNKEIKKVDQHKLSEAFEGIRNELGRLMIGQTDYLDQLCVAFKRPFVTGYDQLKPKNVILILGNRGTGKHTSLTYMAELLKEKKLGSSGVTVTLDLSLYTTVSEFNLFLSDLYKCLYGQSDVVLFENFEKCHSSVLDVITTLTLTGRYKLGSRYIFQNHNLVEATGMLLQDSISEIYTNGKFFVFASERKEKEVYDILGEKFMDAIGDLLYTESFTDADLLQLAGKVMQALQRKCYHHLSFNISWNEQVLDLIASSYKSATGAFGLDDFVQAHLYKPLAEYKLRNSVEKDEQVSLSVANEDQFTAFLQGKDVNLASLLPRKRSSALEDIKKELEGIVGIESVKQYVLQLEDNLKIQQRRELAGFKSAQVSMHMIFTGNPGTGKTTIARIVAKYLKALGVLSTGQLREVTRADLVGQYVGHTAKLTNDVIKSALGGVLFIDEAYALCRDKHDTFGLEAIDTLVKGIEDHRDDLVVILAGYQGEMEQFLKINSGLKSRFPNQINFEDYTSEEMYEISKITAKTKGYRIAEDCREPLIQLFDQRQIKGRNDSGNGRLVRNVIEGAILHQSKRLLEDQTAELDLLIYEDFHFDEVGSFDLEASLAQIIGLEEVKEFVRTQYKLLIANEKRKKAGLQVDTIQSLNMIFQGNPGTGKTTIARIVASMFKEMGLLKSGHLVETDRGGLVAEYVGHTAKKTEEVFRSALGGVLFIDEAYALSADGNSFGMEAINTLVKLIEDYRGEIIVILAGYKKEMSDFLKSNSGLESRFPLKIDFPDYTAAELFGMAQKLISSKGFVLAEGADKVLEEQISLMHKHASIHSGNGRMVRNYIEEITRNQSARIATSDVPIEEMNLIIPSDVEPKNVVSESFDLEERLLRIIGLDEVKEYIRSLNARLRMQNERKKLGLPVDSTQTLHMIFKGNPGTGKTMVARTVAEVLYNIGIINSNKLIETDRAGLVAGYVGQTALKTREVVLEALGGVLFIDEAYSLSQGGANDFGKEAIDTLVKLMDDYRERIVVILAGYSQDMDEFLTVNPGLKSRFPNIIEFKDYTLEQLMQISEQLFTDKGYELASEAKAKLQYILAEASKEAHFGNGRYVRNVFERAVNNQAIRLNAHPDLTRSALITITDSDLERV